MQMRVNANDKNVKILGRTKVIDDIRYINYSCSGIEFEFTGTKASVTLCTDGSKWDEIFKAWVAVFIDDEFVPSMRFSLEEDEKTHEIFQCTEPRKVKIRLMKMSEAAFAKVGIKEIVLEGQGINPTSQKEHTIEFIGDSITCGYGNEGIWDVDPFNTTQENPWEAFAAKTACYFNADFNCVSWSGIGVISSWTETDKANDGWLMPMLYKYTDAAMDNDLEKKDFELWDNNSFIPQIIVINLGTNDTSYTKGIKERVDEFTNAYYNFLKEVRSNNPNSEIICSLGAMGQDLCPAIENAADIFKKETHDTKIHTLRFDVQLESDGVGSDWHPSIKTHDKMSKQLISKIKDIINW